MSKKYHLNLIKNKRSYTPTEIARLLALDVRTCLRWISSEGLKPVREGARPLLVMGHILKDFLKKKQAKFGCELGEEEFYCLRCRSPVMARPESETIRETGKKIGKHSDPQLVRHALCGQCGTPVRRFVRVSRKH